MAVIKPVDYGAFFDTVSPAIETHPANYTLEVKSAFLQAIYDRGNLSSPTINDSEFLLWLRVRLRPLLVDLSPSLVTPLLDIGKDRSCKSSQEIITMLDSLRLTLRNNTKREIFKITLLSLQGPTPLKCYTGGSLYIYLKDTFLSFGFPDLSMFTSLLPATRESELLSTITASELNQLLSQPNMIDNNSDICVIFNNYNNTPAFLENEDVPDNVKMATLPCVWPLALNSKTEPEVESWFVHRLRNYLKFLNKSLISPTVVQNATCLAFQRLVSVMGTNFTYNNSEFGQGDVYTTIKTYLSSGSGPRCYNAKDQELNSTSWFVNYIGSFVTFITPDDLATFISSSQAKVFLEDRANLELFNNTAIPENVTDFYISQLFELNPTFNLRELPGAFLCSNEVPIGAYTSVNEKDTLLVLKEMATFCNTTVNPEASTALASNIQTITPATFATLGSASAALTTSKITSIDPTVLVSSLSTLSAVDTWSLVQASTIIQIMIAGGFQIKSASSLESLGTLVSGVPSNSIEAVPASELLKVSKSPAFVSSMLTATVVVQQTFVKKIVSIDPSPAKVVLNVPDAMATHIAPSLLVFTNETVDISVMNRKTWTPDQAALFFGTLDTSSFDTEQLSPSMLQGFTCTSAQKMKRSKVRGLVRACRSRKSRAKVVLKQSQLTCMYNLLKGNLSQNFGDYPSDMLLYFKKGDVKKANCRSYISAVGAADFTVASSILNKGSLLLSEAKTCLDIKDSTLSRDNVEVMGNMACTLDGDYIRNADPLILEKLKVCKNLSDSQVVSIEWLLLNRTTPYGDVNTWTKQTLNDLGSLPLYFTKDIWGKLKHKTKKMHLKKFMPRLRKSKTKKRKLKHLFKQMSASKRKRGAGCTVGNITQLTASDPSFPFGYDAMQFDLCLDVPVLKDNLNSICEKVDDDDFQTIILKKLNQAYPSGVADNEVQMLGSVSRRASIDNISKWSITKIGTLAALMDVGDGPWEAAESKAIITSYLNSSGETLDSTVLNTIGLNLCSLDVSTLMSITPESIRNADPLNMASCSSEQKRVLYEISKTAFSSQRNNSGIFYNLIKSSLGGAPLLDVEQLSTQGINMDVLTFTSLDPSVITALNVTTVQDLMGSHVSDLELFAKHPVVQNWVNSRLQVNLNKLGLNLTTNRTSHTTAPPSSISSTNTATSASVSVSTSASTPATASGSTSASTSPPASGLTSASTPATASGSTSASTPATASGSTSASTSATASGSTSASTSATASGSTSASTSATTSGSTSASTSATASGSTSASTSATASGSTSASASAAASTLTATQGTTSDGGTELALYSTSIFLAAVLTSVLQMLQLT
ncbi:serine-rich adhesin for platelets [Pleuronectes platessa]|uniref:serine-rich adhesin for platelets n=1 Tax=Pleuronectes platessa TaxID=8262 RepID=UPI00232A25E1|nr:serine-rich adhesin for platelets [Pleuronectes platessa]